MNDSLHRVVCEAGRISPCLNFAAIRRNVVHPSRRFEGTRKPTSQRCVLDGGPDNIDTDSETGGINVILVSK